MGAVADNSELWVRRAEEMLQGGRRQGEIVPFAVSMLTAIYGPQSEQLRSLNTALEQIMKQKESLSGKEVFRERAAFYAVQNTVAEIKNGLVARLRTQIAGEILGELLSLGKEHLDDKAESAKNISAVLVAAAYEDLIRRMGREFSGVLDRPKLESVINSLKDAAVLQGGSVTTAQSYLKFRNDALHADWDKVDRPLIGSAIGFIEGLLLKHFS